MVGGVLQRVSAERPGRAGQFFYIRYSQWGSAYDAPNGFATSKARSEAQSYANKIERLKEFAARFGSGVPENLDWSEIFEKYDGEETCSTANRRTSAMRTTVRSQRSRLEGDWLVSYAELSGRLDEY